ncbi:MMPL family transporter [Hamadaea tsunoensis]|uniref:MMPL family transporter n=1 Tax=Hamadaea tsunoensis TaxID=53368 RepID=UPI0003FF6D27|nr:MMPL family transporter [Hamadaea tsunoensis]
MNPQLDDDLDAPRPRWRPSTLLAVYARLIVASRWVIVAGWVVAAWAAVAFLPAVGQGGEDLEQLVSLDNPAVHSELASYQKFGFPLLSRVAIVQRDPHGLPMDVQAEAATRAWDVSQGKDPDAGPILAAVPVTNTAKLVPGSREDGTTIITYLFTGPDVTFAGQVQAAHDFVDKHYDQRDKVVGVTGSVPARVEQSDIVLSHVRWVEAATVAAVFLIVAFAFRSVVAPILALAVAGLSALLTLHVGGALATHFGVAVPQETQPLLVALLLGVVTDYVVFYLSAVRGQLAAGADRITAARWATARFSPIIATAGATAAAGTGALLVAGSPTFRAFGPGMAVAVLIGMIVAVTLVPALLAILGRVVLWSPRRDVRDDPAEERVAASGRWWARVLTWPGFSFVVLVACVGGLLWAAAPIQHMSLGVSFVSSLPADDPTRQAADQAEAGFAGGILSPTELLVEGTDLPSHESQLAKLAAALRHEPGVAAVIGPGQVGVPPEAAPQVRKLFQTPDGTAARFLIVLKDEPLGATAVRTLDRLRDDLPGLAQHAGLTGVRTSLGGDTAIAQVVVDQTTHDLGRIAIAALAANLLFLALYLRALIAPIALLACSVLAIGATLGLTTRLFQDILGHDGLTFYVPFAAAVLLVALGSDYNIFGIGPAWKEAGTRPLREALALTLPQSARAIRTAAITLAVSFGLLLLIPLGPFQELAFALSVGILIDAFVVRSLLAPALLSVIGTASQWPGRQLIRRRRPAYATDDE